MATPENVQRANREELRGRAAMASARASEERDGVPKYTFSCDQGHRWVDDDACTRHGGICPKCGEGAT